MKTRNDMETKAEENDDNGSSPLKVIPDGWKRKKEGKKPKRIKNKNESEKVKTKQRRKDNK